MPQKTIISTFDIAGWFSNKATQNNQKLSQTQLQNMLFLAQMHHTGKHGYILMPSMFVCYDRGFYDPNIESFFLHNFPLPETNVFEKETDLFLESVWQKYALLSEQELQNFVTSLPCWQNIYNHQADTVVNPFDIVSSFVSSISGVKAFSASKPKIRLSQNGPVQVSPWHPRKLSQPSEKKEN